MKGKPSIHYRDAAAKRFSAIAMLDSDQYAQLQHAADQCWTVRAQQQVTWVAARDLLLLDGWACRIRLLEDGRRQILQFLLPGEMIDGLHSVDADVIALTDVIVCKAPQSEGLALSYSASRERERKYLFRQIVRLGRLNAYERIIDWLCEIHERLDLSGHCDGNEMAVPLTQDLLADALGLTHVHVNRTLQTLRRDNVIDMNGKVFTLHADAACKTLLNLRTDVAA